MNNAAAAAAASEIVASLVTHGTRVIFRADEIIRCGTVVTLPTDSDPSGHPVRYYLVSVAGLGHFRIHLAAILRVAGPLSPR